MPYNSTMNKNRLIPTVGIGVLLPLGFCLWLCDLSPTPGASARADVAPVTPAATPPAAPAAASPAGAPAAPPTEAELTLDEAVKKVAAFEAFSAELVETVDMLKQKFAIQGFYRKASGGRIFLKLVVSGLPGSSGEMQQVCDGVTLWDYQQVLEYKSYRKIMLGPVLAKLKDPVLDPAAREQVLARLGLAGPEVLLAGLRKAIHFDQKEEGTLKVKAPDGATVSRPVWILRGAWQDRQGLLGPNQQPLPETAMLPAYVPSQATLTIGKDDGWPYKVRLAGRPAGVMQDTRRIGPDGRPIGTLSSIQKIDPSVIVLNYSVVSLAPSFKTGDFDFSVPAGAHVEDSTEALVSDLEQEIQRKIAAKKAETAKSETLLEQPIEVRSAPAPEGSASPTPPPLVKPK